MFNTFLMIGISGENPLNDTYNLNFFRNSNTTYNPAPKTYADVVPNAAPLTPMGSNPNFPNMNT